MAERDAGGRFRVGASGNPGGRPRADAARLFSGRRAARAMLEVLAEVGPGLTVVILDARGLAAAPAVRREDPAERGPDYSPLLASSPGAVQARVLAQSRAERDAREALEAEGWREDVVEQPGALGGIERRSLFRGPGGGESLGWIGWRALIEARAAVLLGQAPPLASVT